MPNQTFTIYTNFSDTWETLITGTKLQKEELAKINPHIAQLSEIEPGIPIDVPEEFRRERTRSFVGTRAVGRSPYAVARDELLKNIAEIPGPNDNPRIRLYHSTTKGGAEPDEVSWCSSFVNFCVEQAGMTGTDSKAARSWHNENWGRVIPSDEWQVGDIIVFWREAINGWKGHVGFLVDWQGARPQVLGGNQGDRLSIATPYPFSSILSVRRAN